jgi:hypothetical protein
MTFKALYVNLSQASVLMPVTIGILNYKRLTRQFRVLFYFFIATVGFEAIAEIMKYTIKNNMPDLHAYTLAEFLALSVVFYFNFRKDSILRLFIGINAIAFIGVAIADAFFISSIWEWNTLSRSYSSVSLIGYSLVYFFFFFKSVSGEYSVAHPMFWVSTATLFYFGTNTLYFMLNTYFKSQSYNVAVISVYTHATINIIAYSIYTQSFRCFKTLPPTL